MIFFSAAYLNESLFQSCVDWNLFFLLVDVESIVDSLLSFYVVGLQMRSLTFQLTAYNLHTLLLFLKAWILQYRGIVIIGLLRRLPIFLKVPLYKALFLLLLLPLPIVLAINNVSNEELWEEEEDDLSDDEEDEEEEDEYYFDEEQ